MKNITEYNTTTKREIEEAKMSRKERMKNISYSPGAFVFEAKIQKETEVCIKCGEGHLDITLDKDTGEVFGSCDSCGEQFIHITDTGWNCGNYNRGANVIEFYTKWAYRVSNIWRDVQTKGKSGDMRVCYMEVKELSGNEIERLFTPYIKYLLMYSAEHTISNLDIYSLQDKYKGVYNINQGEDDNTISVSRIEAAPGSLTLYDSADTMVFPMWKDAYTNLNEGEVCLFLASQDSDTDVVNAITEEYGDVSFDTAKYYNMRQDKDSMGDLVDFITKLYKDYGIKYVYIDALTSYILDTTDMPSYIHSQKTGDTIYTAKLYEVCAELFDLAKTLEITIYCVLHDYVPHNISHIACDRYYTV